VPPFCRECTTTGPSFQHDQRIRRRLLTGEPTGDGFDFAGDIDRFDPSDWWCVDIDRSVDRDVVDFAVDSLNHHL